MGHRFSVRQPEKCSVPTGDEDCQVVGVVPELTGDDLRFLPARLGGTAPTYEAAYSKDFSDMSRTRDEFTG